MRVRHARVRWSDDRGANAVEYGLVAALVAVVIIAAVAFVGSTLLQSLDNTGQTVDEVTAGEDLVLVDQVVVNGVKGCPDGSTPSIKSNGKCVKQK